jgi:hypothetical protein
MANVPVKLNRKLNLVIKIDSERGQLHVIASPISRAIFEDNFMIMCRAYSAIYMNQLGNITGPQAAALLIKREAKILEEEAKGEMLLQEIKRLINILIPPNNGGNYEMVDFSLAVKQGLIDEEVAADIEAAICFFTLALRAGSIHQLETAALGLDLFWNAEISSLTLTEYTNSLRTSTTEDVTGTKPVIPHSRVEIPHSTSMIPQ